jgi:hypothetical protein
MFTEDISLTTADIPVLQRQEASQDDARDVDLLIQYIAVAKITKTQPNVDNIATNTNGPPASAIKSAHTHEQTAFEHCTNSSDVDINTGYIFPLSSRDHRFEKFIKDKH